MPDKDVIIMINPACRGGKGWKKWLSVRSEVHRRLGATPREIVIEHGWNGNALLPRLIGHNDVLLISAGGDGTINLLVNALMQLDESTRKKVTLGAIGLGSSNDFLKPFRQKIGAVPVLLAGAKGASLQDTGRLVYTDAKGILQTRYFMINASLGITAEANWRFNHPGRFLLFLKKRATGAAIVYTAVSTILSHHSRQYKFHLNSKEFFSSISNINILKLPYVSGSFWYKESVDRNDGRLHFNACLAMSKWELLRVLIDLQKGLFRPSAKTVSTAVQSVQIEAAVPFVFEYDGETGQAAAVSISVLPNALNVLTA